MVIFFIGIVVLILIVIFFGILFFMGGIIFGANKLGYKKFAKYLSISILLLLLFGAFNIIYFTFKEQKKSEKEVVEILSYTNLKLNDDFEIIKQKEDWDLTYNKINFTLRLSDNDYKILKKKYSNNIIRDSISHKEPYDYDTLKVKIDSSKKLFFYRAHHNFDN